MSKKLTTAEIKKALDAVIADPPKYFETWPEAFAALCMLCEDGGYSLSFDYHSGWFQAPVLSEGDEFEDEWGEPFLDESLRGWTVVVGMTYFKGETEDQALYTEPSHAVYDGLRLVRMLVEEELERQGSVLDEHNDTGGAEARAE